MCFSATASFTAASVIGSIGVLTLSRASRVRDLPLAGVPLLFAAQQAIEGMLWLVLPRGGENAPAVWLASSFAVIALVIWPLYAPFAAVLVEDRAMRRRWMGFFVALGAAFAAYSIRDIWLHPYHVVLAPKSLCYINDSPYPLSAMAFYIPATCGAFLLSSQRTLQAFGALIACGLVAALTFFFVDLVSVWCFFAAAASGTLLFQFLRRESVAARAA